MSLTRAELIDEITVVLSDRSTHLKASIPTYLNEALFAIPWECATKVPELKKLGTVTTVLDQNYMLFPAGHDGGKVLYLGTSTKEIPQVLTGLEGMLRLYPGMDKVGDLESYCQEGSTLYYQGIPTTPVLCTILYYTKPEAMDDNTQKLAPSWIPEHLQRPLLVHRAAAYAFNILEDSLPLAEKVNTNAHMGLYNQALVQFNLYLAKKRISCMSGRWTV